VKKDGAKFVKKKAAGSSVSFEKLSLTCKDIKKLWSFKNNHHKWTG